MKADMSVPGGGLPPFWQIAENPAPGLGWRMYGAVHWIWLAAGAAAIVGLIFLYRRLGAKGRKTMLWIIVALQLLNEVDTQIMLIATGQWGLKDLPLHLCSLTEFVFLAHVLFPTRTMSALVYAISFPAAAPGLAMPTWCVLPVWNFASIHSFVFHFLMILYAALLFADGYRPRLTDLWKAMIPFFVGVAVIFALNKILGTDFLYMNGGTGVAFLEALVRVMGIYGYLVVFPVILPVLWTAMFLPFELYARKKEKRARETKSREETEREAETKADEHGNTV